MTEDFRQQMIDYAEGAKARKHKPEGQMNSKAVVSIRKHFKGKATCYKYHVTNFGKPGHSDIYGCIMGRAFFLEGKLPAEIVGKKKSEPRPNQAKFLKEQEEAGAIVGVYHSPEEAIAILEEAIESSVQRENNV